MLSPPRCPEAALTSAGLALERLKRAQALARAIQRDQNQPFDLLENVTTLLYLLDDAERKVTEVLETCAQ